MDQINILAKSIESLETRFDIHVTKTENKLDQIVDILQTVASLQERDHHQSDEIKRLNTSVDALFSQSRQHNAEDVSVHDAIRDKHHVLRNEFEQYKIIQNQETIAIKKLSETFEKMHEDYKAKSHFLKGVLWILSGVLIVGQSIAISYYNSAKEQLDSYKAYEQRNDNRIADNEEQLRLLQTQIKELRAKK